MNLNTEARRPGTSPCLCDGSGCRGQFDEFYTRALDKLMQSEALSAILSSGDEPTDAPVGIDHDAVDPAPTSADDNVDMVCPLVRLY